MNAPGDNAARLVISVSVVERALVLAWSVVSLAGLGAGIMQLRGVGDPRVTRLFNMSEEANVPTWWSSALLLSCALWLFIVARSEAGTARKAWIGLAIGFAYISLDETAGFHEFANLAADLGGLFTFAWVIPGTLVVVVVGVALLPFVRSLPPSTRRRFLLAGAVYVTGALGVEMLLGWWISSFGPHNLGHVVIDLVEESMEIAGASLFLASLVAHVKGRPVVLDVR